MTSECEMAESNGGEGVVLGGVEPIPGPGEVLEGVKVKEEPVDEDLGGVGVVESSAPEKMHVDETNKAATATEKDEDATLTELIAENERLQGVFKKLNSRQSVLEEFIEVQYGDNFDTFLKNRERLVKVMGLGDEETDKIDGSRSAKSTELANLLKLVKKQAENYNSPEEGPSTTGAQKPGGQGPPGGPGRDPPYSNPSRHRKRNRNHGGRGKNRRR